jgi:hypothetical protein
MPKIFEYFGFVFFFYSNEHEPIHVHVIRGERQSIFELILEDGVVVSLLKRAAKGCQPLLGKEAATAETFIKVYSQQIIQKWVDYFIMKKKIDCTEIKIRL